MTEHVDVTLTLQLKQRVNSPTPMGQIEEATKAITAILDHTFGSSTKVTYFQVEPGYDG